MSTKSKLRKGTRRSKHRGGAEIFEGAPVNYSLSGDWSSRMSLGQGSDYFKYHQGQHGGNAPYPQSFESSLPGPLRGPALMNDLDRSFRDISGLKDQAGGRRRRRGPCMSRRGGRRSRRGGRRSRRSRRGGSRRSRRSRRGGASRRRTGCVGGRRTRRRRRGGALGYSPYGSNTMLLDNPTAYAQAGLNPEWKTDVAFVDAKIRDTQ